MKDIDPEHYNSFNYIINNIDENIGEALQLTFSVVVENFGHKETIALKENGENIYLTQSNKMEYIHLYIDWFFNMSIQHIFKAFKHGFNRVCEEKMFKVKENS